MKGCRFLQHLPGCLFLAAFLAGVFASAASADHYVSAQTGDDGSGNGTTNTPWKTITKAFSVLADSNATVYLSP